MSCRSQTSVASWCCVMSLPAFRTRTLSSSYSASVSWILLLPTRTIWAAQIDHKIAGLEYGFSLNRGPKQGCPDALK